MALMASIPLFQGVTEVMELTVQLAELVEMAQQVGLVLLNPRVLLTTQEPLLEALAGEAVAEVPAMAAQVVMVTAERPGTNFSSLMVKTEAMAVMVAMPALAVMVAQAEQAAPV